MNSYILPKTPQFKPTYNQSYFCSKTLDQYHREFNSEIFDYYGITDNDKESIEGRYKVGSYFIKCEQCKIEIVA